MAPEFRFPEAKEDIETAIKWVRANARTYKVDPSRIVLAGESAGGFLVNYAGTHETPETKVAAVIDIYGPVDYEKIARQRQAYPNRFNMPVQKFTLNPFAKHPVAEDSSSESIPPDGVGDRGLAMHQFLGIDHVQLAMPAGQEAAARAFYCGVLGLVEEPKPASLAARGGAWFRGGDVRLHLGVDPDFHPARKAHPAILVSDLAELAVRCDVAGFPPMRDEPVEGYDRVHVFDPFGNRIELMERR